MLLSTVIIMDVIKENDMSSPTSKSFLKIKLEPIFQSDFAFVKKGNDTIYRLGEQKLDFFKEEYEKDLNLIFPSLERCRERIQSSWQAKN